ncbi:MAG: DUF4097 family beta strand repeat-containing protein [Candidatus Acidiferrales bacterium]
MSNGGRQRSSIFGGLLLIFLGLLFLIQRFDPALGIGHLVARYWPVLLIVWGVAKLIDHMGAQRTGEGRPAILSGGEAALLFLVVLALIGMSVRDWVHRRNPDADIEVSLFGERFSESQELPSKKIPAGAHVTVTTERGNITIHAGEGDELRVAGKQSATASTEAGARDRMRDVKIVIDEGHDGYRVHTTNQEGARGRVSVDLDVTVPKNVTLSATSARGDISISGVAADVSASARNGDVEIHDVSANVSAELVKGDARISDIKGNTRITGRGNEIDLSDVGGDATLEGDFFGPIRVRNVAKTTHFASQRSDLTLLHLTGRMELDSGELSVSDVSGFAKLITHNKDIQAENVAGRLEIVDTHGDIQVRYSQPPKEEIAVTNESGEVDFTLPAKSAFEISAFSRSGEIANEFEDPSLKPANDGDSGRLNGKIGAHGPKITIVTSYGTISLHKSS